jgi:Pectinacetylesterase
MKITYLVGFQVAAFALVGCGSSGTETPAGNDAGPASADSGSAPPVAREAGAGDAGGSGPFAASTLTPGTWTWVPVDGAICRDGSPTGFGVSVGTATDKLMIYLEGGGACFNALTCGMNPAKYGVSNFTTDFVGASAAHASTGIFNRGFAANPVKDWTFIYVPYCTGDVHAGNHPDQTVTGVTGKQQFVGYVNVGKDLQRIVPSFPGLTQVLLTGISAGGFGAASDYVQVARAFGSVPVYEIDDSGPPMPDPYNAKCLLTEQVNLWGFDQTILKDCGSDCSDLGTFPIDFAKHVGKTYPNVPFGLIESTDDGVITQFFGFAANNCTATVPTPVPAATFTAGLVTVQSDLQAYPNFGSFIFGEPGAANSTQHTSLGGDSTFQTEDTSATDTLLTAADGGASAEAGAGDGGASAEAGAGDGGASAEAGAGDGGARIKLVDWITQLIGGKTSNVGP